MKFVISVASLFSDLLTNLTTITTPITLALSACKITRHSVQKTHVYTKKNNYTPPASELVVHLASS